VAVKEGASKGSDRVDLAKLPIEELAPSVLSPAGNDGRDSEELTGFDYEGAGGCKEVLLNEGG
jgi:hypothetical protein